MKKTTIAISLALALGSTAASAAPMTSGTFEMIGGGAAPGPTVGFFPDVTGDIGGGAFSVASPSTFFGLNWTAHSGTTFGPGTYTFDASNAQDGSAMYTGIVVGAGQVGGHILFNYNTAVDIDVINVWDVTTAAGVTSYVSTDGDGDGKRGIAMIDGAFPGFSANFDFTTAAVPVPAAVWLFGSGLLGLVGVARRKKAA